MGDHRCVGAADVGLCCPGSQRQLLPGSISISAPKNSSAKAHALPLGLPALQGHHQCQIKQLPFIAAGRAELSLCRLSTHTAHTQTVKRASSLHPNNVLQCSPKLTL